MFFSKKSQKKEDPVAKKGIKKMDAMITGAILGGVVASIYGVKKLKDAHDEKSLEANEQTKLQIDDEQETKKRGFFSKLFSKK